MYRNMLPNNKFPFVSSFELAKIYVPYQTLNILMEPQKALNKGTIFKELYSPYNKKKK